MDFNKNQQRVINYGKSTLLVEVINGSVKVLPLLKKL